MKSKLTILMAMAFTIFIASCSKDKFNENDAINAQKDLLNLKYQHELDLETLKQKGATAMQQLMNTAVLEQLKLNDSLATKKAIAEKKQDYSVTVVDVYTNAPIAGADVTVSSEGKIYTAKTGTDGIVIFSSLYLYPTSTFMISKTGYAATQILQRNILQGAARLWNTSDLSNEISGTLYIDTDLTNQSAEKVGANVLVTASSTIQGGTAGSYTVYFPTYTTANGNYTIKVPPTPAGYNLSFEQIAADQKLYVNATEDDAVPSFPSSLPRITTLKTYFNVNSFNATVPSAYNYYYFKVAPDKNGKIFYAPGFNNYSNYYNNVYLSNTGNQFQLERINSNNYYGYDPGLFNYEPNTKIDVELVDVTGTIMQSAPKLVATVGPNGKITMVNSTEGGYGYFQLKRDNTGNLVPDAKGVFLKAILNDPYSNTYTLNFSSNLNITTNRQVSNTSLVMNKGEKKVVNFYYGSGESRVKQVY
ncbi:hypothetical protein TH53_15055 [Pedobacter lusitanus]|uniref:Uncharacterized protein n=1 Tax=Pedobacter lusitanus TaxID=1503925 RepID=A0A0D0F4D3_9SPHI|nr:hypothetical protein [Pedobacter lusitanus]KIO76453.1 hypothetical protein TH53_15055 [Pedobacter lusitanus]